MINQQISNFAVSLTVWQWTMMIILVVGIGMAFAAAIYMAILAGFKLIMKEIMRIAEDLKSTDDLLYETWKKSVHAHDRLDIMTGEKTQHVHLNRRKGQ